MPKFDIDTALTVLGNKGSPIDALGLAFGVPNCLLDFGKDALKLLPSALLVPMSGDINNGMDRAFDVIADVKKKILRENGIIDIDTESGEYRFVSDSSRYGLDANTDKSLNNVGGFLSTITKGLQTAGDIYLGVKGVEKVVAGLEGCINDYDQWLELNKGYSGNLKKQYGIDPVADFSVEMQKVADAKNFITSASIVLGNIQDELVARFADPSLEPVLLDDTFLSGTDIITASKLLEKGEQEPIFRLVFGPPLSKNGQFLLSVDGLYYDSQNGGLPVVSGIIPDAQKWKFNYDPNLGGKGVIITKNDLNNYFDTLFDVTKVDNSPAMKFQYDSDHFLKVLEGQKNKQIYDLSSTIQGYITSGYTQQSALVTNLYQQLVSLAASHQNKIDRRKKQIEAAIKAPSLLGSTKIFNPGEVPVNDFSYLQGINLPISLEKQTKLIFHQAEISSVVLPLSPKFVKANQTGGAVDIVDLIVPPVGKGGIIFGPSSLSATDAAILNLTDEIVTDHLFAIYNFLEPKVVNPDSSEFNTTNCAPNKTYGNAQLVATSIDNVFSSGLAIPLLKGIAIPNSTNYNPSAVGSYVKFPNTQEFQDWTYDPSGFSFEAWIYNPNIGVSTLNTDPSYGWGASSFHKIILGSENNGGLNKNESGKIFQDFSNNTVRGMLIGFTRDIQITSQSQPTDSSSLNSTSSIHFYVAPTRSVNASDITFINPIAQGCDSSYTVLKCSIPISTSSSGKAFNQVSSNFMLVDVVGDITNNQLNIYLDGVLMVTSGINAVFGVDQYKSPNLPSFKAGNSFEYSLSSTGLAAFTNGPKNYGFFTPWILGSGWTDGDITNGGFMGSNSGKSSGFGGRVGSVKFYSKPLSIDEVLQNYNAQKGMFKNIVI